jgi:hypothetical protein
MLLDRQAISSSKLTRLAKGSCMPSEKVLRAKYSYDRTGDESAPTVMLHQFAVFAILRFYFGLGTSKCVTEVAFLFIER